MKATGAPEGIIGIEENKPEAIAAMKEAAQEYANIRVEKLKKKYPQGGEKQLIYALTGKTVPAGGLPIETGCIVDNVATAYAIHDAVCNRQNLTERVVTVTAPDLKNPGNFIVRNGTPLSEIIDYAGGLPENTGKVIAGVPMMAAPFPPWNLPPPKDCRESSSSRRPIPKDTKRPCIRCGRCVAGCPMGLEPYLLMTLADNAMWNDMAAHDAPQLP